MILLDTNVISEPQRRDSLHDNLEKRLLPMFANRVLSFDMACTKAYAELLAKCRAAGLAVETADAFIAAVALANGFAVATRDTSPFEAAGVNVINPWQASP
jgi:predicted nucleic acid-binding protein